MRDQVPHYVLYIDIHFNTRVDGSQRVLTGTLPCPATPRSSYHGAPTSQHLFMTRMSGILFISSLNTLSVGRIDLGMVPAQGLPCNVW